MNPSTTVTPSIKRLKEFAGGALYQARFLTPTDKPENWRLELQVLHKNRTRILSMKLPVSGILWTEYAHEETK